MSMENFNPTTHEWAKVDFPLTDEELSTFCSLLNTLDFKYFEACLNPTAIRDEDIEKVAVVKHCLEQMNDVIASRLTWYEEHCGLKLPTDDELDEILDKYHN